MLLRLCSAFTRPYRRRILALLLLQALSVMAALYLPSLNAKIIDDGVAQGDIAFIWRTGGVMIAVALVQIITAIIAVWLGAQTAMAFGRDLRSAVYRQVTSWSEQEIGEIGTPSLITRGTNDIYQVQMLLAMVLTMMIPLPIMVIGGVIMATREDVGLSWLVWVSAPMVVGIMVLFMRQLIPLFQVMQDRVDGINSVLREQILGLRVIRAFVREPFERRHFADANEAITSVSLHIGRLFVIIGPLLTLILFAAETAVLWFGGQRVDAGLTEIGSLTAFMQYLMQILMAVMIATFMAIMFPRAMVCSRRISEVLQRESSILPPSDPVPLHHREGVVCFEKVGFRYPGAEDEVLHEISFTARPGTVTAIIGSTGAGKSTLLHLIPRLLDVTSGRVLIDGVDVRRLAPADLAGTVSLTPQRPFLFSGTVASNLRFGQPEAPEEQLWEALRIAQAEDFVRERSTEDAQGRPQCGLDSAISQGGGNVSGGQRQRLSIARALVARPLIHLFDDSFSALDVSTDARLRRALLPHTREATVIVVAQRVSTITEADQILVLDAGRIVARGTHKELLKTSETYREIVDSQFSAVEEA